MSSEIPQEVVLLVPCCAAARGCSAGGSCCAWHRPPSPAQPEGRPAHAWLPPWSWLQPGMICIVCLPNLLSRPLTHAVPRCLPKFLSHPPSPMHCPRSGLIGAATFLPLAIYFPYLMVRLCLASCSRRGSAAGSSCAPVLPSKPRPKLACLLHVAPRALAAPSNIGRRNPARGRAACQTPPSRAGACCACCVYQAPPLPAHPPRTAAAPCSTRRCTGRGGWSEPTCERHGRGEGRKRAKE